MRRITCAKVGLAMSVAALCLAAISVQPAAAGPPQMRVIKCPKTIAAQIVCYVIQNVVWDTITRGGQRVPNRPICRIDNLTITSLPRC